MKKMVLIILIIGLIYSLTLNSNISIGGDDANYIIMARSILSGRGYTDIQSPIPIPHTVYPPFFPLMLCPLILLFGENIFVLKLISLFSMLSAIYVFFLLLKDYNRKNHFWIILIFGLNPVTLSLASTLISEAPYFLFSFLTLLLLSKYSDKTSLLNKYLWFTLLTMVISFYTRTAGIVLLPTAFLFLIFKRNLKKAFLISLVYSICIFPWILRGILIGSVYLEWILRKGVDQIGLGVATIGDLLSMAIHNFVIYGGKVITDIFFYPHFYNVAKDHPFFITKVIVSLILSSLILYGYIRRIKKEITPVNIYVIFMFIVCLFWPVHGPRFISPILPFLILFLFSGIEAIARKRKYIINIVALIIFLPGLFGDFQQIYKARSNFHTPEEKSYLSAMEWIKQNTFTESKIMCKKPGVTFVITDRRAMYYPSTYDAEKTLITIKKNGIDYVIFDAIGKKDARFGMWTADKFLRPVITKYPDYFILVFSTPEPEEAHVYKVTWEKK